MKREDSLKDFVKNISSVELLDQVISKEQSPETLAAKVLHFPKKTSNLNDIKDFLIESLSLEKEKNEKCYFNTQTSFIC